jgi:hypothetical protein
MSRFKKAMAFVVMFGLYAVASTMEYNDAVMMEQAR